jgi:hypothetical protein
VKSAVLSVVIERVTDRGSATTEMTTETERGSQRAVTWSRQRRRRARRRRRRNRLPDPLNRWFVFHPLTMLATLHHANIERKPSQIIVHVNDRLGTKAAIPCLASDPVGESIRLSATTILLD